MAHSRRLAVLLALWGLLFASAAEAQPEPDSVATAKQKARAAASAWLQLVDDGDFGESWDAAAPVLRERLSRDQWRQQGRRARDSLRTLTRRTLTLVQYRDSLRRASVGPVVILTYRSSFEGGRTEELLLTARDDTTWKVAGYEVTPLRHADPRAPTPLDGDGSP